MSALSQGYEYDIFISYRHNDNRSGWVTEFVKALREELASTIKEPVSVYFDSNPHDGLLETHNVDKSLEGKLKCLILLPIISHVYCDTKSFAWQHEFCAFNKRATEDQFGRDIKLSSGNVASRILPVKIHDLDEADKTLLKNEIGGTLRAIEFIYKEPGVNRPLKSTDNKNDNQNKTDYRNQVNKVANAVKEIITVLKNPDTQPSRKPGDEPSPFAGWPDSTGRPPTLFERNIKTVIAVFISLILLSALGYYFYPKLFSGNKGVAGDHSIAVLSFVDMSPGKDQEYLGDGMAEEILNELTKINGLKVIGRTSSFSFKGKNIDLKTIGETLGASTILEGSIQKSGNKIRITAQLINVADEAHIWSERYDSELEDIFSVQDEIAAQIVQKLKGSLFINQSEDKGKEVTNNFQAYEMYLKARNFRDKGFDGQRTASEYYQKAIDLDPSFAKAYSELAYVYWSLGYYGIADRHESFSKSKEAALKAISLDEGSYDGYDMLSYLDYNVNWDWESSLKNYEKAVSLGLPLPDSKHAYFQHDLYGTNNQLIKDAELMVEKDPLSVEALVHLSRMYLYGRRYESVIKNGSKTLAISPDQNSILRHMGEAYLFLSKPDLALPYFQKLMDINPHYVPHDFIAAQIKMGNKKIALDKFTELKDSIGQAKKAICYIYFGEIDKAFLALDDAISEKDPYMTGIKSDPHFDGIRSDPRYLAILKKMKFPE